jgi:hypothetical protein
MGEIKSTLDLVMEKTKNLSLSTEEREKQKEIEIEKKIKGILQRLQDQTLTMDQLNTEYERLKKENKLLDNTLLMNEIFNRLDLNKHDQKLLTLLKDICGADIKEIESILNEYQDAINAAASYRMIELREDLAQKHSISGSAVVPNLEADEVWQTEAGNIRLKFEKQLNEQKDTLVRK